MHLRVGSPRSLPPYIKIEPTPLCHLRCSGCKQRDPGFKKAIRKLNNGNMYLSLEDFKTIIDPLKDSLMGVSLSLYGEPMLNPNISTFIEYLHNNNIAVSFPSNLSIPFKNEEIFKLVKSGLDCIEVALDGTTEESYNKYRVGGNFNLVLRNVRLLSDTKKTLKIKYPKIVWKFVVFEHNRHEIEKIDKTYQELGFDSYALIDDYSSSKNIKRRKKITKNIRASKKSCYWLWNTTIIRWDGSVKPCCTISDEINLGNAIESNIKDLWRSEEYAALREGFNKNHYGKNMHQFCKDCIGMTNEINT